MKTKINNKDKIKVITLGCSKNTVDSELLMGHIEAAKYDIINGDAQNNEANIIIINTCGFIQDSKQQSIDTILNYVREKKAGNIDKLFVTGCLSERYKKDLIKEIPEVDEYFGVNDYKLLLNTLNIDYKNELSGQRLLTTPKHYAYLKISEGCDRTCSFCAIPLIRGKHISKPIEDLVKESQSLSKQGVKELLIIAQDSTYYGIDLYKRPKLAELLKKISEIDKIEWIKLHYTYPANFTEEVIDLIADNPKLCKYLDIPFQHINDRILKSMRRSHSKKDIIHLINLTRKKIKDLAIRTTFIVGYPGETEKEFSELYDFVKDMQFERLGVFKYSHEEDTSAYKLRDNVSNKVKNERYDAIMDLQRGISYNNNIKFIHKEIKVLIDRKENEFWIGRSMHDSPEIDNEVLLKNEKQVNLIGKFVKAKITSVEDYDLFGNFMELI
jgi:ribosomal protein S12 methylthiotransferase